METPVRLLSKTDVCKALESVDVLAVVEDVLRAHGEGRVVLPPKISLNLGEDGRWPAYDGFLNAMPAYLGAQDIAGIKWAGGFWRNASTGLPSIMAVIILNDPHTGLPLAIMDGEYITSLRTGATAALGFKYLWQGSPARLAIIGAGTQGRTSLQMTLNVCPLREVIVYDINPQASQRYIKWVSDLKGAKSLSVKAAASVEEAVQGADLILTATSAKRPFLEFRWIDRARVICSLGSYQEITDEVGLRVDRRITDNKEQAKHRGNLAHLFESGRLKDADLHCEIGEVIAGRAQGRISDNQRVFYCPIGMGSEDVGVAYAALREGTKLNVGTMFNMECGLALL